MTNNPQNADLASKLRNRTIQRLSGRYMVVRELVSDASMIKFLAQDLHENSRNVFVVIPVASAIKNRHAAEVFKSKASAAVRLKHPAILALEAASQEDTCGHQGVFLVYDHVAGQSLRDFLANDDRLTPTEIIDRLKPIADALDLAHRTGVLHGGLTPAFIQLAEDGRPHVFGIGVANLLKATEAGEPGATAVNDALMYMSPEELNGAAPSAAQDIYRFGAIVFECLTGKPPFYRGQIRRQILHADPYAGRLRRCQSLPPRVVDEILRCLSKDPSKRPRTLSRVFDADEPVRELNERIPPAAPIESDGGNNDVTNDLTDPFSTVDQKYEAKPESTVTPPKPIPSTAHLDTTSSPPPTRSQSPPKEKANPPKSSWAAKFCILIVLFSIGVFVWVLTQQQKHEDLNAPIQQSDMPDSFATDASELQEKAIALNRELDQLNHDTYFVTQIQSARVQLDRGDTLYASSKWLRASDAFNLFLDQAGDILEFNERRNEALGAQEQITESLQSADQELVTSYEHEAWRKLRVELKSAEAAMDRDAFVDAKNHYMSASRILEAAQQSILLHKRAIHFKTRSEQIHASVKVEEIYGIAMGQWDEIKAMRLHANQDFDRGNFQDAINHYREHAERLREFKANSSMFRVLDTAREMARSKQQLWDFTWLGVTAAASKHDFELPDVLQEISTLSDALEAGDRAMESTDYTPALTSYLKAGEGFHRLRQVVLVEELLEIAEPMAKSSDKEVSAKAVQVLDLLTSIDPKHRSVMRLKKEISAQRDLFGGASNIGDTYRIPLSDRLSLLMTYVPSGTYRIGSPDDEPGRREDETQHRFKIDSHFMIGVTEVTQSQWKFVMGTSIEDHYKKARDRSYESAMQATRPMYYVTWHEATIFCKVLTENERIAGRLPDGWVYRLPTEAEWEYACRAGSTGPYAQDIRLPEIAWYEGNSDEGAQRIATRSANAWGVYDMHGNVSEWCADQYLQKDRNGKRVFYAPPTDPKQPRSVRGGSWESRAAHCRAASRDSDEPSERSSRIGFRIVLGRPLLNQ